MNTMHENVASTLQTIDTIQTKLVASNIVETVHTRPLMVEADCRDSKRLTQAEAISNSTVLSPISRRNAQHLTKRRQSKPSQHVNSISRKETCRSNCSLATAEDIVKIGQQVAALSEPLQLVCAGLTTPNAELIGVSVAKHTPMSVEISSNDERRLACNNNSLISTDPASEATTSSLSNGLHVMTGKGGVSEACGSTRTSIVLEGVQDAEESLIGEPKGGDEVFCGEHGAELCSAEHWWEVTSSEQLHAFSSPRKDGGIVNSTAYPLLNRAHMREFIHYESEAVGIDTPGSDLPEYQWDTEADHDSFTIGPVGSVAMNNKHQPLSTSSEEVKVEAKVTSYIPSKIGGSPKLVAMITEVCTKHKAVFNTKLGKDPAKIKPMELEVDESLWCRNSNKGPARHQTLEKQAEVQKQVLAMLDNEVISISQAEFYSQVHLTPKPVHEQVERPLAPVVTDGAHQPAIQTNFSTVKKSGWRFCIDFRSLNVCCKGMGWPIPNIRHMLQRIGNKRPQYFGKLDLTSGYHQAPIAKSSRRYTAFMTHLGVYEWNRVAMGLKGAAPWFQGILAMVVLLGLIYVACELYIDDLLIFGNTEEEFCSNLDLVLTRLGEYNITVNPDKCELGVEQLEFVGHVVNKEGLTHTREKIEKVLQIPPPEKGKDLKSFLGVVVYVCDHIKNYAMIVHPLHLMLKNYSRERRLVWTQEAKDALKLSKRPSTPARCCTL